MLHREAMLAMPPFHQELRVPKQEEEVAPLGGLSEYGLLEKALSYLYRYVRLAEEASDKTAAAISGPSEAPRSQHG